MTTTDELRAAAAAAVSTLPGVIRLEPTLGNALRRLRLAATQRAPGGEQTVYSAAEGIRLARHGDLVDIHVDATVAIDQPAVVTAEAVQRTLRDLVLAHGLIPGEVTVSVLRLRP